jgi:hypothetical protein
MMSTLLCVALALQLPLRVDTFVRVRLGFSERDVRDAASGAAVVKTLVGTTEEEIALAGVVRLRGSATQVVDRFADLTRAPRSRAALQGRRFSVPPMASDVATFVVPPPDRALLRSCRVGKCVLKLPSSVIDSLRAIDWRAAAADSLAAEQWRGWLLDYVRAYLGRGNAALVVYGDTETPLPLHTGFHALLEESPYLFAYVPEFHHYLDEFPAKNLPGGDDAMYWSTEDVGLRPITTLTHATVYRPDSSTGIDALIAIKLIYASHYFHAGLSLIMVIDDSSSDGAGAYVISLERSLFDTRLGGLVRRNAEAKLRDDLRSRLEAMRRQRPRESPG